MFAFCEVCVPRRVYFQVFAFLLIFGGKATNAFSAYCPTRVAGVTDKMNPQGNSFGSLARANTDCQLQQSILVLSAAKKGMNNKNHPDPDRLYDFIAIEEANKMLQQERLRNERELRQMKITLKRQHQELLEYDGEEAYNIQLSNDDEDDVIDLEDESIEDVERNRSNDDTLPFSPPFADDLDEEDYRQNQGRSHDAAERRTLEIALQQIDEDNQDLKSDFDDQRCQYQSDIEETRRLIDDVRDRFDCVQHELKLEALYFERAKAELEEVLDRERAQARELEQQVLLARREQEILEQAAVEAQHRQEELERQELELRRQEERIQLEREEEERKQQQMQLEQEEQERQRQQQLQLEREELQRQQQQQYVQQQQEEHFRQEELLRNHQELAELEKNQKEFDDIYFSIYNNNGNNNDNNADNRDNQNVAQSQVQMEYDDSAVNGGQGHGQNQNSGDWVCSTQSTHTTEFKQYDVERQQEEYQQQQWEWQETFSVKVTTEQNHPRQPGRAPGRETRKNSRSHGIFMNFNDILV